MIVVQPCRLEQLGDVWNLARDSGADKNSIQFEEKHYSEVQRLDRRFEMIRQGSEPADFSNEIDDVTYSVRSSIHSH